MFSELEDIASQTANYKVKFHKRNKEVILFAIHITGVQEKEGIKTSWIKCVGIVAKSCSKLMRITNPKTQEIGGKIN